ncbi:MAG TPA: DUF350 domain-containing protein [Lacunisphaera sp.]|jgi:uncharacterized membrane protein YjfL (UPF0719 family)
MKNPFIRSLSFLVFLPLTMSAAESPVVPGWHAQSLGQAVGYMVLFGGVGIVMAIVGYKLFDKCTPGQLHREIVEEKNVAAAIIGGSVILGVCIIIAAAMLG